MKNNKSLYWYGFGANVKKSVGKWFLVLGIIFCFGGFAGGNVGLGLFGLIFVALGGYMVATGSSQRFDYKQKSGSMIHKGDW